jgi:reductive dehalogenase
MPDNLTRREFFKDLGLMGTTLALGKFAVGENSKAPIIKRPSWVKETEKPTTEIDWDMMERYDERKTCRGGFVNYVGEDRLAKLREIEENALANHLSKKTPGYSLKDMSLYQTTLGGLIRGMQEQDFLGPQFVSTPEERGTSKWTGTPEDATALLSAAMRFFGAAQVGVVEIESGTTEKLIYGIDPDGKQVVISNEDQPYEDDEKRVIHKDARWIIVWSMQMSQETILRAPTPLADATTLMNYEEATHLQRRTQDFLRGLGYWGLGEASLNALGIAGGFAVMAGLGEMGRHNRLNTPEYGPAVRVYKMVTDLPLAPTKPIDAGLMEFCKRCKKCSDACPSKALHQETEPTWEVKGEWNNPGHKAYYEDSVKCRSYWYEVGSGCTICFSVCPLLTNNLAAIHSLRNNTLAALPATGKFWTSMDNFLYGRTAENPTKDPEKWWTYDLPEYGFDSTSGHKTKV